jgi:hypothetical protein
MSFAVKGLFTFSHFKTTIGHSPATEALYHHNKEKLNVLILQKLADKFDEQNLKLSVKHLKL